MGRTLRYSVGDPVKGVGTSVDVEHGFAGDAEALRNATSSCFEDFRLDVLGHLRGYSESEFARVKASTGTWLLRRWPPGFGERRLRFVHQALLESRSRGFRGVPSLAKTADGDTVARMDGYLYDAQEWTAGRSLSGMPGGEGPRPTWPHESLPKRYSPWPKPLPAYTPAPRASTRRWHPV